MTPDAEYLTQLLTHPGWLLFLEYAKATWGPAGYGKHVKQAVMRAQVDKADIAAAVGAVDKANEEINALLSWPTQRIKQLQPAPPVEPTLHRGGR